MPPKHAFTALDPNRNEIRLLHFSLDPRTTDSAVPGLIGRLQIYALSYVWGSPTIVSAVSLEDASCIPIAGNLLDALLHIAVVDSIRSPIWVDAVCMNQNDNAEKSWQVQMMDKIYSKANTTFVYLGPSTICSDEAIRSFSAYGRRALQAGILDLHNGPSPSDVFEFGYERWSWAPLESEGGPIINEVINSIQTPGMISPVAMLDSVMESPWWSRMWVLQELLLSPNPMFVCGRQTISARELVASLRLYEVALTVYCEHLLSLPTDHDFDRRYTKMISQGTRHFHNLADVPALALYTTYLRQIARSRYHGIEEPYFGLGSLWDLVQDIAQSTRPLDSSDPRDRIYALIGLARLSQVEAVDIQPDYALSCAEVYAQATHFFMRHTGPCMLETAALSRQPNSPSDLPSWAVDWSSNDLVVTSEPVTEHSEPCRFVLDWSASNRYTLISSVQFFGEVDTMSIVFPSFDVYPPMEETIDTVARLLRYLLDVNMYFTTDFPDPAKRNHLQEGLMHAMVQYSTPKDTDIESAESSMGIKAATSLLQEQMSIASKSERPIEGEMEDVAAEVLANSLLGFGLIRLSDDPVSDIAKMSPEEMGGFSLALKRIRETATMHATPFVLDSDLVGFGPPVMRNDDILVGYEEEKLRFIVRPVDGGLFELIGKACIYQLDSEQAIANYGEVSTISLC